MLYMVEMDFPHPERLAEWHRWYQEHLGQLLAMPGFLAAQRFEATSPTASPFLAIYSLAGADVITSPAYRAGGGPASTGEWRSLMTNWRRNLFEGLEQAPEVPEGGWVALMDRVSTSAPPLPEGFRSLRPVGLDRSVAERGILFGQGDGSRPAAREEQDWSVRVFRPITTRLSSRATTPGAG